MPTRFIAILNHKGGVGKTSLTLNLGAALSLAGWRVLLIDLDSQANLSAALGVATTGRASLGDLLLMEAGFEQVLQEFTPADLPVPIGLLPASFSMTALEKKLIAAPAREFRLKNALHKAGCAGRYDFVLMDCPPNLSEYTTNALTAADEFLVPFQPEYFSFQGVAGLLGFAGIIAELTNPHLQFKGLVLTKYNAQSKRQNRAMKEILQAVRESEVGDKLFATSIRQCTDIMRSPMQHMSVLQYAPQSTGAADYRALATELLQSYQPGGNQTIPVLSKTD